MSACSRARRSWRRWTGNVCVNGIGTVRPRSGTSDRRTLPFPGSGGRSGRRCRRGAWRRWTGNAPMLGSSGVARRVVPKLQLQWLRTAGQGPADVGVFSSAAELAAVDRERLCERNRNGPAAKRNVRPADVAVSGERRAVRPAVSARGLAALDRKRPGGRIEGRVRTTPGALACSGAIEAMPGSARAPEAGSGADVFAKAFSVGKGETGLRESTAGVSRLLQNRVADRCGASGDDAVAEADGDRSGNPRQAVLPGP